jgi:hypothetical protein
MGSLIAADPATRAAGSGRPAGKDSARSAMGIVRPQACAAVCGSPTAVLFAGAWPHPRDRRLALRRP